MNHELEKYVWFEEDVTIDNETELSNTDIIYVLFLNKQARALWLQKRR